MKKQKYKTKILRILYNLKLINLSINLRNGKKKIFKTKNKIKIFTKITLNK